MSHLKVISPAEASGEVAEVYQEISVMLGGVPSLLQAWSVAPFHLRQHWEWIKHCLQNENLSGALQATIRMAVSQASRCAYCVDFNAGMLINMFGWSAEDVAATQADPSAAKLEPREKTMLLFVLKAVKDANSMTAADFQALQTAGYSDADIFEALAIGGNMVAGDLIANALQVERDF